MAKNDTLLLNGIIDDLLEKSSNSRGEVFELFAFEQLLKNYDLSQEEMEFGWLDGRNDGGIDGFFIFINGQLLTDPEIFPWPKRNVEIAIWVITCKHHETFQQAPLDLLTASITELMDYSIDSSSLKGAYSVELIIARDLFFHAYKKLAPALTKMSIHYVYASRGDTSLLGESIAARANQIKTFTASLFSSCFVEFRFVGSGEFIDLHRQMQQITHELPFLECISQGASNVILTSLSDYKIFISDTSGELRRYLFEANVRDFLGLNRVNEDIATSLLSSSPADFWWLNNGITILTTSSRVIGKIIQLDDVQIVNGLQTTESIHQFFSNGGEDKENRAILIKVISSSDPVVRDRIIRATNNQTAVELASLHAMDKIQRDIEAILEKNEWYYERRKNYHRHIGKHESRIITPLFIAGGSMSMLLKNPAHAVGLKSKFMKNETAYSLVFSDKIPLTVWPKIAFILRKSEAMLDKIRPGHPNRGRKFLSNWRNLIAFLTVARVFKKFTFSAEDLANLDENLFTEQIISESWNVIIDQEALQKLDPKKLLFVKSCCDAMAKKYNLTGIEIIGKQNLHNRQIYVGRKVDPKFAEQVDQLLKPQPWKPGIHLEIANQIGCTASKIQDAIQFLIHKGKRNRQVDGIVYDDNDEIIAIDLERNAQL